MTSRERVLAAFRHQEPDRVPAFALTVDPKFFDLLGGGDALACYERLGLDCLPMNIQSWCQGVPLMARDVPAEMSTAGGVFAGWDGVDEFGRRWRRGSYVGGAFSGWDDLERYVPDPDLDRRVPARSMARYKERYPDKAYAANMHLGPFGLTMESLGFERFFYTLYDDRDLITTLINRRTDWFIAVARRAQELGAHFVVMGDDVAFKGSTFVSPDDFRELAIPCFQRIAASLEVPLIWHSDGFVEPLIEMALEAGVAGLHALEPPAGNDLGRVKRDFGDRLVLLGNVDCASVLTTTDLDLVRREVDRCLADAMAGGGFLLATSNSLHHACTVEAVTEMYRYARAAGRY